MRLVLCLLEIFHTAYALLFCGLPLHLPHLTPCFFPSFAMSVCCCGEIGGGFMNTQEIPVDQATTDYFNILYNDNKVTFSSS